MIKEINIKNRTRALDELNRIKMHKIHNCDIRFENVHLLKINGLVRKNIFFKNDLFANAEMLWEIMQATGSKNKHNYHGLTPEEILCVLNSLTDPYFVFRSKIPNRYVIVSVIIRDSGDPLIVVIEVGADLKADNILNINKMITMYPKAKLEKVIMCLTKKDLLYKK